MHRDLQRALDALRGGVAGLDEAALARRPPGGWSVSQVVEHLAKGYAGTAYILNRCLEQDRPKARPVTWRDRVAGFVVVDLGWLPRGRQAPEATRPSDAPPDDVLALAESALRQLDATAARAEARFGLRTRLANHPLLGPFDARQWRRFHLVHTRHHLKQIARLRAL